MSACSRFALAAWAASIASARLLSIGVIPVFAISPALNCFSFSNIFSFADTSRALEKMRSEEHTSELQSQSNLVCRLLLEKKTTETITALSYKIMLYTSNMKRLHYLGHS